MCGRFTLRTPAESLAKAFGVILFDAIRPRFNIAPTQFVLAIRRPREHNEAAWFRWGLIPSWAKDTKIAYSTINARAETLATKPAFRRAFRRQRCLILADGFYEWQKTDAKTKSPFWFTLRDESVFAFAGLWDCWNAPDGSALESATIVTTTANELVRPFHERMPVILPPQTYDHWLDPAVEDVEPLMPLLAPLPAADMKATPVSSVINNARNEVDPRAH